MKYIDFMSPIHKATKRDYLARVNDIDYPKYKASEIAKKYDFDYWDGDRRINYGGYKYMPGRWSPVADLMKTTYDLKPGQKVLDIGCGKGFQMFELTQSVPGIEVFGVDVSRYAFDNAKEEIKENIIVSCASDLPFEDNYFDFVFSINTLHNLKIDKLFSAIKEINRVSKNNKYICVESYRNELEKQNLLYWQVTCESFYSPEEWEWIFKSNGYSGDYSFIYFE